MRVRSGRIQPGSWERAGHDPWEALDGQWPGHGVTRALAVSTGHCMSGARRDLPEVPRRRPRPERRWIGVNAARHCEVLGERTSHLVSGEFRELTEASE